MCPRVQSVGCIVIHADKPAKLSNWYATVMGIKTEFDSDEEVFQGTLLDPATGAQVLFGITKSNKPLGQDGRAIMVTYRVDDFDGFLDYVRSQNVAIDGVSDFPQGKFAYSTDPEGDPIEIWEPPEGHP